MPWELVFYDLCTVEYRILWFLVFTLRVSWKQNTFAASNSPTMYRYLCENERVGFIFIAYAD